jgi:hypothetical protein
MLEAISCSNSRRFLVTSVAREYTPVSLLPGRDIDCTRLTATRLVPAKKTIGTLWVACFAARLTDVATV